MSNNNEEKQQAYNELDKALRQTMGKFWRKYPDIDVICTGSVEWGEWSVMRDSKFDGLKFKLSDKQMDDLIDTDQCIVKISDQIKQEKYVV